MFCPEIPVDEQLSRKALSSWGCRQCRSYSMVHAGVKSSSTRRYLKATLIYVMVPKQKSIPAPRPLSTRDSIFKDVVFSVELVGKRITIKLDKNQHFIIEFLPTFVGRYSCQPNPSQFKASAGPHAGSRSAGMNNEFFGKWCLPLPFTP
ncbi:hypothetical protein pipiens_019729 [Culex pipiens pipiens]|uniref:Uncharacterized protein n=1 Tax=Culex pipiens pipiens TaxID=38569 RepID=A0ABD1DSV6_CULPP